MKKTDDDEVVNEELTEEEIEVLSRGTYTRDQEFTQL